MKKIKKIFNIEYNLTSNEFMVQKQDEVSEHYQSMYPDFICKVTTFCVSDKQLVISTTEENRVFMGSGSKLLAFRPLADQSFLNMDDEMIRTYEITITADTNLPNYATAIDVAQAKADEIFELDDSKLPLVTVIDYRWGNLPTVLSASIFGDIDGNGNTVPLIGTNVTENISGGNIENGKNYLLKHKSLEKSNGAFNTGITGNNIAEMSFDMSYPNFDAYYYMYRNSWSNRLYLAIYENKWYVGLGSSSGSTVLDENGNEVLPASSALSDGGIHRIRIVLDINDNNDNVLTLYVDDALQGTKIAGGIISSSDELVFDHNNDFINNADDGFYISKPEIITKN